MNICQIYGYLKLILCTIVTRLYMYVSIAKKNFCRFILKPNLQYVSVKKANFQSPNSRYCNNICKSVKDLSISRANRKKSF